MVLLNRLRLGFSHLNEHKFRHGFHDTLDPFCACRTNSIEDSQHFLLHCSMHSHARNLVFNKLQALDLNIYPLSPPKLLDLLLYGDPNLVFEINSSILNLTIEYLLVTERFSGALF